MNPITLPRFVCRCSKIGDIMTEPQTKSPAQKLAEAIESLSEAKEKYANTANKETKTARNLLERIQKLTLEEFELRQTKSDVPHLSQTCISYLEEWVTDHLYGSRKEVSTKYTQKGITVESDAIEFASDVLGWGWVPKNTERRTNHYLTGEADVVLASEIADVKSSWDQYTFPLLTKEIPTKGYDWQLQGYMHLWDKPEASLVYCLMDAPEELVQREARSLAWSRYEDEVTESIYQEVKSKLTFSHLPDYLRIKTYPIHRDQDKINSVMARVEQCNVYIKQEIVPRLEEQMRAVSGQIQSANS